MKESPSYYAIIPANVRYDKNIPPNAKLLYGEITALCSKEGYCWASNKYFSDLYGVAPATVSEWVRKLCAGGYITYVVHNKTKRQIYLVNPSEKADGGIRKNRGEVSGKPEHSNTVSITENSVVSADAPFNWENYLKKMDDAPQQHVQLLAYFFRVKQMRASSEKEAKQFIIRHSKAASRVSQFEKQKVFTAIKECRKMEEQGISWTMETVFKQLTK